VLFINTPPVHRVVAGTNCSINFTMESSKYNVCGAKDPVPESCQQWVMLHHLTETGPELWYNNMSQYIL
jgi:hypothetical protein